MRYRILALVWLGAAGCDDVLFGVPRGGADDTGAATEGWCAVQSLFNQRCTGCHGGTSPLGGLNLRDDPYGALVGQPSSLYDGAVLVIPGDPTGSLLIRKITGTTADTEGSAMPPGVGVDAETADVAAAWIADGAPDTCDGPVDTGDGGSVHPDGWVDPTEHGRWAKLNELVNGGYCTDCHGDDLRGGVVGVACDGCHLSGQPEVAWRTTCTFCHGEPSDGTGAPPQDIDDSTTSISFAAHRSHVHGVLQVGRDCTECHRKPDTATDAGHGLVGDSSPGRAEVGFATATVAGGGSYATSTSTCTVYCHGPGRPGTRGAITTTASAVHCASCHADLDSGRDGWDTMSGEHEKHLREPDLTCHDCHSATTTDDHSIADVTRHVNGSVDLVLPGTLVRTGATCNGACHGFVHDDRDWN